MSWGFHLARSWQDAYQERLPAVQALAQGARIDWNARREDPSPLGMQLQYDLAPIMEDFLQGWIERRRFRRVDLVPFWFDVGETREFELEPEWLILRAHCITDGSPYATDKKWAARADELAPLFKGGVPDSDEGWEIVHAAFQKSLFELARAAYRTQLPVIIQI